jgi:hypothetical protein
LLCSWAVSTLSLFITTIEGLRSGSETANGTVLTKAFINIVRIVRITREEKYKVLNYSELTN